MPAQCSLYWQGTDAAIEVHDPTRGSAAHAWTARLDVTVQSIKKKNKGESSEKCARTTSSASCKQAYRSNRNALRIVLT